MGRRAISLEGLIVPAGWDATHEVTLVSLLTDDEGEYRVETDSVGQELTRCLRSRVRVSGWLQDDEVGGVVVTVRKFRVLDP